jgi:hypothetical protein
MPHGIDHERALDKTLVSMRIIPYHEEADVSLLLYNEARGETPFANPR